MALWIKDEINSGINIINANKVDDEFLLECFYNTGLVKILKCCKNYYKADKVDISTFEWKLYEPTILVNGELTRFNETEIILKSNFDLTKRLTAYVLKSFFSYSVIDLFAFKKKL